MKGSSSNVMYASIQATLMGGNFEIPPSAKNFENTPLKILGKIFEKRGKFRNLG